MELCAQAFELTARFVDCIGKLMLFVVHAAPFLFDHDFFAPDLKDRAHSETRRGGHP
jgi:hypothetical protein